MKQIRRTRSSEVIEEEDELVDEEELIEEDTEQQLIDEQDSLWSQACYSEGEEERAIPPSFQWHQPIVVESDQKLVGHVNEVLNNLTPKQRLDILDPGRVTGTNTYEAYEDSQGFAELLEELTEEYDQNTTGGVLFDSAATEVLRLAMTTYLQKIMQVMGEFCELQNNPKIVLTSTIWRSVISVLRFNNDSLDNYWRKYMKQSVDEIRLRNLELAALKKIDKGDRGMIVGEADQKWGVPVFSDPQTKPASVLLKILPKLVIRGVGSGSRVLSKKKKKKKTKAKRKRVDNDSSDEDEVPKKKKKKAKGEKTKKRGKIKKKRGPDNDSSDEETGRRRKVVYSNSSDEENQMRKRKRKRKESGVSRLKKKRKVN